MNEIELVSKRKLKEKHFLQEDGTIVAKIYDKPVHFLMNGLLDEIDNTLIDYDDYLMNKNNNYKIVFNKKNRKTFLNIKKDKYFINLEIIGDNGTIPKIIKNSRYHEEIVYNDILKNIDLKYDLYSDKIKEYIYIKDKNITDIVFKIDTNLDLLFENNRIVAKNDGKSIFQFENLFLYDSNNVFSKNIFYKLYKEQNGYLLKINLDKDWINSSLRKFPIIIDPTIIINGNNEMIDTYIFNGDTNSNVYLDDKIKVGCEVDGENQIINRALLKFNLPSLGTGSQIVESKLKLVSYPNNNYNYGSRILEIHRITEPWIESNAKWNNMYDKYDNKIESKFEAVLGSVNEQIINEADVTQLVNNWYLNDNNYGMLIKAVDESEHLYPVSSFYSKDNNFINDNPMPILEIKYINQNGIVDYMNYIENYLVDGVSYINTFNGNHIINIDLFKTLNNNFPINLSLFYNTNDSILNNYNEYGRGFKLNYNQFLNIDSINNIINYTDESGYVHYFYDSKEYIDENGQIVEISEENKYYDGDYLDLILSYESNKYILEDKYRNKLYFETFIGSKVLLTKIVDKDNNIINIDYNDNYLISNIYNENDSITINYNNTGVSISYNLETINLYIMNNKLFSIIMNGNTVEFTYNSDEIVETIKDENNLKYYYEYYSKNPFRVKKVEKLGINNSHGEFYLIKYGINSTLIVDQNNVSKTLTFNDNGCLFSINRQSNLETLKDSYGKKYLIGRYYQEKNKIISESGLIKYTKNYFENSSFENQNINFSLNGDGSLIIDSGVSVDGNKSLRFLSNEDNCKIYCSFNLEKNRDYCFSAFFKNINPIKIKMYYYNNLNEQIIEEKLVLENNSFVRCGLSIFYPIEAVSSLYIEIESINGNNQVFIDNVQLEDGKTINNYNMIYNGDFSNGLYGWDISLTDIDGNNINNSNKIEVVNINNNEKAISIKMSPVESSSINTEIPINGLAGDTYTICFWYKNNGIKCDEFETYNNVIVGFEYLNEIGHCVFPSEQLNINGDSWQFFSYEFVAEYDFSSIILSIFQSFNANHLYITNVGLYKNVESNNYSNDINGNIISKKLLNNNVEKYKYDNNSQLLNFHDDKNENACYYEYEKNSNNRLKSVKSSTNLSLNYSYVNNNISQIKTTHTAIIDFITGKCYTMRVNGTNKYLGLEENRIKAYDNSLIKWVIESVELNDIILYKIKNNILNNKYLSVFDERVTLCGDNNINSLFYIEKNSDGSFSFKSYITNKFLKIEDNSNNYYITVNDESELLKIYFETVDNTLIEINCEYNEDNNIISEENHLNNITSYEYTNELLTKINKPNNGFVSYEYDEHKRIKKVNDGQYDIVYHYNSNGMLEKIIFGEDTFELEYDDFLNLQNIKINNRVLVNKQYDSLGGKIERITYGNLNYINFLYDEFDRIIKMEKDNENYKFVYNNISKLGKIISDNINVDIIYDTAERIKTYECNDLKIDYEYDSNDNVVSSKKNINNESFEINYTYNSDNSLKQIQFGNNILKYEYDNLGRIISYKYNDCEFTKYSYDKNGYRNSILIKEIQSIDNYKYIYDKQGNISKKIINGILNNVYKYDKSEQLTQTIDYKNGVIYKYNYDKQGNIKSKKSYRFDGSVLANIKYNYNSVLWKSLLTNYDGTDIIYDQVGNPVQIGNNIINWKNGNELCSYTDGNNLYLYDYDYKGNRIKKIVNGMTTDYYWENNQIVFEMSNNNMIYYIRDVDGQLIGFIYDNNNYFYEFDAEDDIVGILNSNNEKIVLYEYDDWGKLINVIDYSNIELSKINPFRYRSYYYDEETKLYYLNSRYYNPEWGRFLSPDPLIGSSEDIVGYNLFTYVNNNPINNSDFSGNFLKKLISGIKKVANKIYNSVKTAITKDDNSKDVTKDTSKKAVNVCVKPQTSIKKNNTNIKKSENINKLPTRDIPNSTRTKPNGDTRTYGPDGKATHDIDRSHPQHHPELPNPHAHEWTWDGNQPTRGPAIDPKDLKDKAAALGITLGAGYVIYRVVRMVPSLFPGFWWTIPGNLATP